MGLGHYNGSIHMKQRGKIERGGGATMFTGEICSTKGGTKEADTANTWQSDTADSYNDVCAHPMKGAVTGYLRNGRDSGRRVKVLLIGTRMFSALSDVRSKPASAGRLTDVTPIMTAGPPRASP